VNSNKKIETLTQHQLAELGKINTTFHYPHQNNKPLLEPKELFVDIINPKTIMNHSSIQGWNGFIDKFLEEILDKIKTLDSESCDSYFEISNPNSPDDLIAIHTYLATVINFMHSNQFLNTEKAQT
jgi:hypothetical protein